VNPRENRNSIEVFKCPLLKTKRNVRERKVATSQFFFRICEKIKYSVFRRKIIFSGVLAINLRRRPEICYFSYVVDNILAVD